MNEKAESGRNGEHRQQLKHPTEYSDNDVQVAKTYTSYTISASHMVPICCSELNHMITQCQKTVHFANNQSILKWRHNMESCPSYEDEHAFPIWFYLLASLLLRCAGDVWRWVKGLWWTGAGISHDWQPAGSQKNVKRDKAEVLGDAGLVGRPGNAVMAGATLLLDLDDPDSCAVTAKPAVLPGAAVTRGRVHTPCWVVTAFLLRSTHLNRGQRWGCINANGRLFISILSTSEIS